jgi:hypothetical protein
MSIAMIAQVVMLSSCGGSKIVVIEDSEANQTIYRLSGVAVDVSQQLVGDFGNLSFMFDMYVSKLSNDTTFFIRIVSLSISGLAVRVGDTLSFDVEGSRTNFLCAGLVNSGRVDTVMMGAQLYNIAGQPYKLSGAWYKLDRSIIKAAAKANTIAGTIHSAHEDWPWLIHEWNMGQLRAFQEAYVP